VLTSSSGTPTVALADEREYTQGPYYSPPNTERGHLRSSFCPPENIYYKRPPSISSQTTSLYSAHNIPSPEPANVGRSGEPIDRVDERSLGRWRRLRSLRKSGRLPRRCHLLSVRPTRPSRPGLLPPPPPFYHVWRPFSPPEGLACSGPSHAGTR
jgi:hypothetical protein